MTKENLVKAPERRVKRDPMLGTGKLRVKGKDPAFEYRIVNDTDDRVFELGELGYVPETSEDVRVGSSSLEESKRLGTVRQISVGGGTKAILMKQRKDWYDEDQAAKQAYVAKTEQAMKPNPNEGTYGKVDLNDAPPGTRRK